ncbi:MAG: hypothetical protein ACLQG5_12940 [Methanobacterium sp.]|jgi:hypothetical protein
MIIALIPIFGKPFILYIGIITFISFSITAMIGLSIYRGWLDMSKFKWHPTMVVISFSLAIFMAIIGRAAGNVTVGSVGILTFILIFVAAILGFSIHQGWLSRGKFLFHPTLIVIALFLGLIHGVLGVLAFG